MSARDVDFSNYGFRDLVVFYKQLRSTLYEEVRSEYPDFSAGPISLSDAIMADTWDSFDPGKGRNKLEWIKSYHYYTNKKRFKRFDLAIHRGGNLVGLSYGMPSQTKTKLKVNILEGTPINEHKNDIRVFEMISVSAQLYGYLLGANEVRIMRPLNQKVTDHYCSFGYEYVEPAEKNMPVYCSLMLEDY